MLGLSASYARYAGIAQLVEHHLAKVEVASSSLVSRSNSPLVQIQLVAARPCDVCMDGNETAVAVLVREHAAKATTPSERRSSVFPAPFPVLFDQRVFLRRRCYVGTSENETAAAVLVREHAAKATTPSERCSSVFPAPIPPSFKFSLLR